MTSQIAEEIQAQQNHGREKYRGGKDNFAEDDKNGMDEWAMWAHNHLEYAENWIASAQVGADPGEALTAIRDHMIKAAGLCVSCVESIDRTNKGR